MHGTRGLENNVSHLTCRIFHVSRATSVKRERRTSCQTKVHDAVLVPRFGAWASEHKSDVGKVNAASRDLSITYVLKDATP